jgi:aspartate/methionine/tyrosine aminotransferase
VPGGPTSSTSAWATRTSPRRRTSSPSSSKRRAGRAPIATRRPKGIAGLRRAQAGYYARRFGVKLNPDTQVVATLGSKEGFANMAQAITAPGDVVLVPNPSYPIHAFGFLMAGGAVRSVPSEPSPAFFPALERAVVHSIPKPIALVVCYPSNPTASVASLDFYRDLVAFAKRHELILLSDLAYAEVFFDGDPPPSVLQVPGAMDVAVEFTSLSKTFSMAGWRIGFAVGNERLLAALARVKSYLDYGAFTPVQVAATAALNGPEDCIREMRACYKKRRDALVESFAKAGWPIPSPQASMFAWVPIPERFRTLGSLEFSEAPRREGGRGGGAGHRLRRARGRPRPHRAGRERAAHPPGGAQRPPLLRERGPDAAQRGADRPGGVKDMRADLKAIRSDLAEVKGRVNAMPAAWQLITLVFGILGGAFLIVRLGLANVP